MTIAIKSISFSEEYERELKYFNKQFNKSKYICELIKKDIDDKKQQVRDYDDRRC